MDVVGGLHVEALPHLTVHRSVQVLLHVAVSHRRSLSQSLSNRVHIVLERLFGKHPVDQTQPLGLDHVDLLGKEVQLAGLGGTDEAAHEVRAAIVAAETHPSEGGGHDCVRRRIAKVARQSQRQPGTGGGTRQGGEGRLRQFVEFAGGVPLVTSLQVHSGVVLLWTVTSFAARLGHALHVATGAEGPARAGQDDRTDITGHLGVGQRSNQALQHRVRHRVAAFRTVQGDGHHPVGYLGADVVCPCIENTIGHVFPHSSPTATVVEAVSRR